jgi:hypothetical protein
MKQIKEFVSTYLLNEMIYLLSKKVKHDIIPEIFNKSD